MAGPIAPGQWHVLLGPYKVGQRGCEYRVEVTFGDDPGAAQPRPTEANARRLNLPAAAEPGWLRGDLHCHTLYSDGDAWPAEMLAEAVRRGLDFLGVTDHNQVGHHADYAAVRGPDLPIVLPGVEVTTFGGHWNAWGTATWWDFREPESGAVGRAMRAAAAAGALVSVNHPKPYGPAWEYPEILGYHGVEVWNGAWEGLNQAALRWWEERLRAGRRLVAVGGSDTHYLRTPDPDPHNARRLGRPTTWVQTSADCTPSGVLAALRAGRAFVSRAPDGPQVYLYADPDGPGLGWRVVGGRGAALVLASADGVAHAARVGSDDWADGLRRPDWRGYLRAELLDEHGGVLALTNPLYAPA